MAIGKVTQPLDNKVDIASLNRDVKDGATSGEDALYQEFSDILGKIASRVSSLQEDSMSKALEVSEVATRMPQPVEVTARTDRKPEKKAEDRENADIRTAADNQESNSANSQSSEKASPQSEEVVVEKATTEEVDPDSQSAKEQASADALDKAESEAVTTVVEQQITPQEISAGVSQIKTVEQAPETNETEDVTQKYELSNSENSEADSIERKLNANINAHEEERNPDISATANNTKTTNVSTTETESEIVTAVAINTKDTSQVQTNIRTESLNDADKALRNAVEQELLSAFSAGKADSISQMLLSANSAVLVKSSDERLNSLNQGLIEKSQNSGIVNQLGFAPDSKNSSAETTRVNDALRANKMLPKSTAVRTLEKVELALQEVVKSKDGKTISVRLDPPSLGNIKVDVSIRDSILHARIVAESPQINNFLREKAHELQSMLRKMGLDVDTVSVSVSSDQNAGAETNTDTNFFNEAGFDSFNNSGNGNLGSDASLINSVKIPAVDDHWVA